MATLSPDESFNFELNRVLAHARYRGSDTLEVLRLRATIIPGDMESWYAAFAGLAARAEASAGDAPTETQKSRRVSYADRMFAASNYYRSADFFLHGNADDPRIMTLWEKQTKCYDAALRALGNGVRYDLKAEGFSVPIIYFKASIHEGYTDDSSKKHPTLLLNNGYDGAMEEMLHISGLAALERGYNVILYEGPGMPTVRRSQNLGFIHDWERVVRPVVDFAVARPEVDASKLVLSGYSMGGNLAVRAAAFEKRIKAAVAIDGIHDLEFYTRVPPHLKGVREREGEEGFNRRFLEWANDEKTPTPTRWGVQQGLWSFNVPTVTEFFKRVPAYSLAPVVHQVECPVFVGDAEEDMFFRGQPQKIAAALGDKAYLRRFTAEDSAGMHCQVGAASLMNMEVFDWLEGILGL